MSVEPTKPSAVSLLEKGTAAVLVLVIATLGWMVAVAFQPNWGRLASEETEIVLVLLLLVLALALVSVVALLHTRAPR